MSISSYSLGEASIAAQAGAPAVAVKKPPSRRSITAQPDSTEAPEPR